MRDTKAFSLIELMIAAALGLILMGMVMYTLSTTSRAMNGTLEQVELHNRARAILQKLYTEFGAMQPGSYSYDDSIANIKQYQFLSIAPSLTISSNGGNSFPLEHDLIWIKYIYDESNDELWRDWDYVIMDNPPTKDPTVFSDVGRTLSKTGTNSELIDKNITRFAVFTASNGDTTATIQVDIDLKSNSSSTTRSLGFAVAMPGYY